MYTLGRHIILELFDCDVELLSDLEAVKAALVEAARRAEATIVTMSFHEFNPFGISGIIVITESHLSIHTWPEHRYAAVDIFSCGRLKPDAAVHYLIERFAAERVCVVNLHRGVLVQTSVSRSSMQYAVESGR